MKKEEDYVLRETIKYRLYISQDGGSYDDAIFYNQLEDMIGLLDGYMNGGSPYFKCLIVKQTTRPTGRTDEPIKMITASREDKYKLFREEIMGRTLKL